MIPLSPILSIGTFAVKSLMMIWSKKQSQKHEQAMDNQALLSSVDRSRAQAAAIPNKEASIARRTVLIAMTAGVVIMPLLAPLFGLSTAIGWHVVEPGFLWMADKETIEWRQFGDPLTATVVVAPILYDLYGMVIGFYFGGHVTRGR